MTDFKRYTITSALPYANGPIHIGHLAGVYIPADIYVRYLRSSGKDVVFVGGSDEHGVAIELRARKEGKMPQEIVDRYHQEIKSSFKKFGISFDIYYRTSDALHHQTASEFFTLMYKKNKFTEVISEQFYDVTEKQFLADRYIKGECPICGYEEAYGDQCEKCGSTLTPSELKHPKSVISGETPSMKKTKHWYLPLEEYETWLKKWILEDHKNWKSNVYGQCKSWIDSGLKPRPMTRDLSWGIPVPIEHEEGKVLYVWFDAPIGYISATKAWAKKHQKNWEDYWKSKDTRLIHFIGKDNIVFHCIIFPTLLKAEGSYILPDNVPANEFLNLENNKISTSKNWAVWLHEYLEEFPNKQDVLRYVLTANAPETKDNNFTWKDFQSKNNNELVAIFGNFINRTLVLSHKYFDGKVPKKDKIEEIDQILLDKMMKIPNQVAQSLEQFKFREALINMMELARLGNKYLTDTEPWKVIKHDKLRVATILNISLQITANLSIICEPFLPFAAQKIRKMLNFTTSTWESSGKPNLLHENTYLNKAELIFDKIEDEEVIKQINKLEETKKMIETNLSHYQPVKEEIIFDDFTKMDLRVGTILAVDTVKKSNKLLKINVNMGFETRIILSGVAEYFSIEKLVGQKVIVVANLAPRKMMGIESKGMILFAENADGKLVLVTPEKEAENGAPIT